MHARYYSPAIGHFLIPDTVLPNPGDSLSYDRYAYVRNNPIALTDPSGHIFGVDDAILLAMVIIGAAVGATIAAINGGNIVQGVVAGAIGGFMAAVSTGGSWAYFAASQSVNVALHATSGGQWLLRKAGDAMGSQLLGDVLVTAMVIGATMKTIETMSKPTLQQGTDIQPGQENGVSSSGQMSGTASRTYWGDFELTTSNAYASKGSFVTMDQFQEAASNIGKHTGSLSFNTGFGETAASGVRTARILSSQQQVLYRLIWKDGIASINVVGVGISSPVNVKGFGWLQHTGLQSINPDVMNPYPSWSYAWGSGVCHQTTALAYHKLLGITVSPLDIPSIGWSGMLTTGLYGYYGIAGGLSWRFSEPTFLQNTWRN